MAVDGEQVIVLTKWGVKWLKFAWNIAVNGSHSDIVAAKLIHELDTVDKDPEAYVDAHVYTSRHTIFNKVEGEKLVGEVVRKKKVLRKGQRSSFAAAVAQLAYNKFGERPMSEANIMVTRKWIQKLLEDKKYSDLRTCDKNLTIDRALFLSFVPTQSYRMMKLAVASSTWKDRCDDNTVFGKVFRLVAGGGDSSPSLDLCA
jgi:hypothetical protein